LILWILALPLALALALAHVARAGSLPASTIERMDATRVAMAIFLAVILGGVARIIGEILFSLNNDRLSIWRRMGSVYNPQ